MSVLNTVTSLVFIFLLYSLFATAIQEALATVIQRRSETLYQGIRAMLSNTPTRQLTVRTWIIYALQKLFRMKPTKPAVVKKINDHNAKIEDTKNSSTCLYDLFYEHPIIKNYGQNYYFSKPSYLSDKNFGAIMVDVIKNLVPENKSRTATFQMVQEAIDQKKDAIEKEVVQILQYHLNEAAGDLDVFQSRLEQWYNDTMDRVSGWYKRNTQFILFIIGISLAFVFNVDTIEISSFLSNNPATSEQMADIAVAMIEKDTADGKNYSLDSIRLKIAETNTMLAIGWEDFGQQDKKFVPLLKSDKGWIASTYFACVDDSVWNKFAASDSTVISNKTFAQYKGYIGFQYVRHKLTLTKLLGFFLTAIAVGLGAPFWFDLLSKLSTLRTAGKAINSQADATNQKGTKTIDG